MSGVALTLGISAQLIGAGGFVVPAAPRCHPVALPASTSADAYVQHQRSFSSRRFGRAWTGRGPLLTLSGGGQYGRSAAAHGLEASAPSSSTATSEVVGSAEEGEADGTLGQGAEMVDNRVPITLISGFLGAGKTSLLQNLLRNREGVRIGMVVNDMAEVNVDAKLVRDDPGSLGEGADSVELQNGCICCSMSQELFVSVNQLVELADAKGQRYDHIVIESSGISEPKSVRSVFQDAESFGVKLMNQVRLDTMVTVVDAGAFLAAYTSGDRMLQRPDLGVAEDDPAFQQSMMEGGGAQRAVVDLLVEQVECADVLVLNKMDTLDEKDQGLLTEILLALNPHAKILGCTYGKVGLEDVLGVMDGQGVADFGTIDDHKETLASLVQTPPAVETLVPPAAASSPSSEKKEETKVVNGDHAHSHAHGEVDPDCEVCQEQGAKAGMASSEDAHSHAHNEHAHEQGVDYDPDCAECNQEGHGHDHSHSHSHGPELGEGTTSAARRFGIDNFVYRQRRPFHPERLAHVLKHMPSASNLALAGIAETSRAEAIKRSARKEEGGENDALRTALGKLVRSKGFMWLAFSDKAAMYWSHAGASFEVLCLGRWWASLERQNWPSGQEAAITEDFEGPYGDRRQELVFIGLEVSEAATRRVITAALDECILTDGEMRSYEDALTFEDKLHDVFPSKLRIRFT